MPGVPPRIGRVPAVALAVVAVVASAACSAGAGGSGPSTTVTPADGPDTVAGGVEFDDIDIPTGVLVAVPTQNRVDQPKNQFQIQIHNGTRERYDVAGVQFRWTGFTTPMTERDSIVVGGQVIDFPAPFPGADCRGDGGVADMPDIGSAGVRLALDDGSTLDVPVVDKWGLARRLYLLDCERQFIESQATIEWVGLREEQFDGRPVTVGDLQIVRGDAPGDISIASVSNTIVFVVEPVEVAEGEPLVEAVIGTDRGSAPFRIVESRCDPHALAEVSQPYKFIAQVDLGDGLLRPYIVTPDESMWVPMRQTLDRACEVTGQIEFVGD